MTKHSYSVKSIIPFSVPRATKNRPQLLIEADQLHVNKKFNEANKKDAEYVDQYEQGRFDHFPFYVSLRASRQSYIVRSSHDHKISYFPIPKCASSSVNQLLYQLINAKMFTEDTTDDASVNIHNYFNAGISELSLNKYSEYFKFTVVRDPIERFVSGYADRILYRGDLDEVLQSMDINTRPDINTFAMNLEDYIKRSSSVDTHFRPMSFRFGDSLAFLDAIIPIEKIKTIPAILSEKTGQELQLPHVQKQGVKMNLKNLSSAALEKLIEFNQENYKLLKNYYSPERIRKAHSQKPVYEMNYTMNIPFANNSNSNS